MANARDIFNTSFVKEKAIGNNNFFNNQKELTERYSLQEKFISSVDYSDPENFAKFGSAEEYYKNAIKYLDSEYPYDSPTHDKLLWINSLSELEFYIYKNEYPTALGNCRLSGSQYIEVNTHIKPPKENTKEVYQFGNRYIANTSFSFEEGVTFESWAKFDSNITDSNILTITAITSSGTLLETVDIITVVRDTSGVYPRFTISDGDNSYSLNTEIKKDEWHHYALNIKSGSIKLWLDGNIVEELNDLEFIKHNEYIFSAIGLMSYETSKLEISTDDFEKEPVFKIGGSGSFSIDETRLWNNSRTIEKIGRYWFTNVDGNDFEDIDNCKLIFYYKFNEGWDPEYQFVCLDYSGNENDGEIINYTYDCRDTGSAINNCGFIKDLEKGDIVLKGLSYSELVKQFYDLKIQIGKEYDETNIHMLYNKFPGFILEQEAELETKHLKQIIQIVCSYFDDLYNKIGEITKYKSLHYSDDIDNIYPFYDKIITSTGFDVSDLFSNLNIVEKISSRSDTTTFDEDIQKIKNSIFQNIYNNLAYILKSKGTEKSIRTFLRAYGVNDNLLKINVYGNNIEYNLLEKRKEEYVKKKVISLVDDNSIFLSSSVQEESDMYNYCMETSVMFPKNYISMAEPLSLFGIQNNSGSQQYDLFDANYGYNVLLVKDGDSNRFYLHDYVNNVSSSTELIDTLYDNTVWNICLRKKAQVDKIYDGVTPSTYEMELYAVNNAYESIREYSCSLGHSNSIDNNGYIRYYLGSKKTNFTGSLEYKTGVKILYCNFWTDYLSNNTIKNHNMDVLNYGSDE